MHHNSTAPGWLDSALSEREGILNLALRAGRIGLWSRNLVSDRADWSAQLHEIFGTTPDTFDGSTTALMALIHPQDRVALDQALRDAIADRTELMTEFRINHPGGELRWLAAQGRASYDPNGRPLQFYGMVIDVTERKRAELTRSHLAAIVESSDDAVISKRLDDQTIMSWNRGAERLFGYEAAEIIGTSILRIIPEELRHEETAILTKLRRGERIDHYDTVRVAKGGRRIEVSISVSPVRDTQGNIVGASKIARDVSAFKEAERKLREEARALETLNRVGHAVAADLELDRIVQTATDAATELTGAAFGSFFYNVHKKDEESYWLYTLSGVSREQFDRFPMPRATAVFGPTFKGEGIVRSDNILKDPRYGLSAPYHGMPPGHLPVCSYLAVPVVSRTGDVIGGLFFGHPEPARFTERSERLVAGIAFQAAAALDNARLYKGVQQELAARTAAEAALRDTEAKLRTAVAEREQLLESERSARSEAERLGHMKDEFLATLSHELRTPLNAIQGWSTLLKRANLTAEERQPGLDAIERNARAQAQIINDLLDMNRIIAGKFHLEVQPMHLHEVINAAIEAVRPSADAKRLRIRAILDSGIGATRGDPNRLQQVMWNLLTNAVKFTPAGGFVQIVLERVNSHVEIMVQDNGAGISAEFLPHVFDRFRQADASTSRRHGGLGLGLSIVKNLVELHGGSVRVKSPGENEGATFVVSLPVVSVDQARNVRVSSRERVAPEVAVIELPRLDDIRILVVDDEPDGRTLLARILQERGAVPACVGSAQVALESLQRDKFDLLLSDIGMPELDGYGFIQRVRALGPPLGQIPAIAVTAYARPEDRQRSLLAGYQMHIAKPLEANELIAAIASLLKVWRI